MKYLDYFLELFGELTIGKAVVVIGAIVFLFYCYRAVEKYFTAKAIREAEKDQKLHEVMDQAKQYPIWHQQSVDIRDEINQTIKNLGDKLDIVNETLVELKRENGETKATSSRYRILRFDDEIRHDVKHTKEHFDQILEDIKAYGDYCDDHPNYENNKAVLAIENIKETYKRCAKEHTFL